MQEYQVTLEGQTLPLPKPFMVLATQNPVETEGTYPLPEAQLDRFLFKIEIGYPSAAEEVGVVVRATAGPGGRRAAAGGREAVSRRRAVHEPAAARRAAARGRAGRSTTRCASCAPRATGRASRLGAGSRGALALVRGARAVALLDGRDYVTPDDIKRIALPALRHRIALAPDALLEGRKPNDLLDRVIETVAGAA